MNSFESYIRKQTQKLIERDPSPINCFEAELNNCMGQDKVVRGFKTIVQKAIPSKASLELLIERNIFESEVFKELSLFPGPKARY